MPQIGLSAETHRLRIKFVFSDGNQVVDTVEKDCVEQFEQLRLSGKSYSESLNEIADNMLANKQAELSNSALTLRWKII